MQSEITSICRCAKKVFFSFLYSAPFSPGIHEPNRLVPDGPSGSVLVRGTLILTILYSESNDRIVQFHYSLTRWSAVPSAVQSAGPCSLIEGVWPFEFTKLVIRTWFLYWIVRTRPKIKFELSRLKTGKEWVIYYESSFLSRFGSNDSMAGTVQNLNIWWTTWLILYESYIWDKCCCRERLTLRPFSIDLKIRCDVISRCDIISPLWTDS